jgi:hypothetical protein
VGHACLPSAHRGDDIEESTLLRNQLLKELDNLVAAKGRVSRLL